MINYKFLFPIFLFVRIELAEEVYDPCSEFCNANGASLVKCPSEKPNDDYLECYDLCQKENLESIDGQLSYWCWSRIDNDGDELKNMPISAGYNYDSKFNDMINKPFTANFHINETHIACYDSEEWVTIPPDETSAFVYCPTSSGIPVASFYYFGPKKMYVISF